MPLYHLQIAFMTPYGVGASLSDTIDVEAETEGEAIAEAKVIVNDTCGRPLHSAILRTPQGLIAWSLRRPDAG